MWKSHATPFLVKVEDHRLARGTAHVVNLQKEEVSVDRQEVDPVRSAARETRGQQRFLQLRCGRCGVHECGRPWVDSSRSARAVSRRCGAGHT